MSLNYYATSTEAEGVEIIPPYVGVIDESNARQIMFSSSMGSVQNYKVEYDARKQDKVDDTLLTEDKTIVGAINELSSAQLTLDQIYPVGSIYMSVSNTNPQLLFGGSWEQIKDTFLLAAGDTYTLGSTGGEAEHVLTTNEMPSHAHRIKTDITSDNFNVTWPEWTEYVEGWKQVGNETESPASSTTLTGGNNPHNNMPPYLTVYMWKRIG